MKKVLFLLLMLMTQLVTFAENESNYRDTDDDVREWGESDGFQIHWGIRPRERTRKPYSLEPGYRCFISGEILIFDDIASRISTTHGMQLDNRFFIGAGLG